jgi:ketosteroid isomerase-like protein
MRASSASSSNRTRRRNTRGRKAARARVFGAGSDQPDATGAWDEHQVELVELIDAGDQRVVGVIYERGKLKGSDAWVEHPRGAVYTVRDQRVVRYEEYEDRVQALEAAGLSE